MNIVQHFQINKNRENRVSYSLALQKVAKMCHWIKHALSTSALVEMLAAKVYPFCKITSKIAYGI